MDMEQQGRFKKRQEDENFDLDSYLDEQSQRPTQSQKPIEEEPAGSFLKNAILGAALLGTAFLWYHDWSPKQAFDSVFGTEQATPVAVEQSGNRIVIDIPDIEIPDIQIPDVDAEELERVIQDELAKLPELVTLPSATDYLAELKQKGLIGDNKLSTFDATQLYNAKVPIEYLEQVDAAGYLDDFNFIAISELYKNNVPFSYINQLDEGGFLENINFIGISELYKNNVSMEYLSKLSQSGYLNDLNFIAITEYYKAGVTTEFLDELKQKDLYNDLNFVSVVELYKSENN